jgi:phosphoglycolate phosphatase
MRYRILIFDLDGTLFRSFRPGLACCLDTASTLKLEVTEGTVAMLTKYWGSPTEGLVKLCWPEACKDAHVPFQKALNRMNETVTMPIFGGVADALGLLREKRCVLNAYTGRNRKGADKVLVEGGIREAFTVVRCKDDVKNGKPHPEGLFRIIDPLLRVGLSPDDMLLVGDGIISDLQCAEAAGIPFLAVAEDDNTSREHFLEAGVRDDFIIDSVRDLPAWLEA